jgi:homoserine kinase
VTAFAPATVANVTVGFDVLGFAIEGVGDRVSVARDARGRGVTIDGISGVVPDLPRDPERNTASVALAALAEELKPPHGFRIALDKGIPLGSGMGGSAASAVAAVVAAARLLDVALAPAELLRFALAGERVASGAAHPDNAAACLTGGLTAVVGVDPPHVVSVAVPAGIVAVVVHPHLQIETRAARRVLPSSLDLGRHVAQTMALAGFLLGCARGDVGLIRRSAVDHVAEPARAALIPGFAHVKEAALGAGALVFGISGSGPSVFAWAVGAEAAARIADEMRRVFDEHALASDAWVGPIAPAGARVVEPR